MDIFKIAGTGILTAVCVLILRENKKELAALIGICGGLIILLMITKLLAQVVDTLGAFVTSAEISNELFGIILKIIAIGYITEFSANICEDCGVRSVADKILLCGKLLILVVSLPIITSILDMVRLILKG